MPPKTLAERQRALREARAAAGLVRVEVWAHKDDEPAIREYAERLKRKRKKGESK